MKIPPPAQQYVTPGSWAYWQTARYIRLDLGLPNGEHAFASINNITAFHSSYKSIDESFLLLTSKPERKKIGAALNLPNRGPEKPWNG